MERFAGQAESQPADPASLRAQRPAPFPDFHGQRNPGNPKYWPSFWSSEPAAARRLLQSKPNDESLEQVEPYHGNSNGQPAAVPVAGQTDSHTH